jgi:hypothetical protein
MLDLATTSNQAIPFTNTLLLLRHLSSLFSNSFVTAFSEFAELLVRIAVDDTAKKGGEYVTDTSKDVIGSCHNSLHAAFPTPLSEVSKPVLLAQ